MPKPANKLGQQGEDAVRAMLTKRDFIILDTNYHTRFGELDIVARQKDRLYFIEVKTRRSQRYGSGPAALTDQKQDRLRQSANLYRQAKKLTDLPYQFDLVTIEKERDKWRWRWLDNIIEDED
ncbi:MAG: YraN family protein [Patescibacteria group bacterium]